MDAVVDYLPSPIDIPEPVGVNPLTGKEEARRVRDDEAFQGIYSK